MIWALLAVGILGLTVGVYVGILGAGIAAANRSGLLRRVILRQSQELIDANTDRAMWQRRALIAECSLPQDMEEQILVRELAS